MKPHLVLGLGNPLMGDEGVGCFLADRLARDPRLPADAEVFDAGTDLVGCADRMAGRTRVTLLDAMLDSSEPGVLHVFEDDFTRLEARQLSAHQLSAVGSLELLKAVYPSLRDVRFKLLAVGVNSVEMQPELSPALAAKLPQLLDQVLKELE